MTRIRDLIERAQAIDVRETLGEAIEATSKDFKLLQTTQMLFGEDSQGGRIGTYRSPAYAIRKYALNPFAGLGNVDVKVTGEFQKDIFIDVREEQSIVVIDSADPNIGKVQRLVTLYPLMFGLNPRSMTEYTGNYLQPAFVKIFKSKMHL